MRHFISSICALFALSLLDSTLCEAQVLNIPLPGQGNRPKNKQYRTAEDILKTPQDTSEFDPENPMSNDFLRHSSRGWFPIPFAAHSIYLASPIDFPLNFADGVRFGGLPTTKNPYSLRNPYSDDDKRYPFKVGSRTDREGSFPNNYYDGLGILYEISLPIPLMLRFGARYAWQGTVLFSSNPDFRFRSTNTAETLSLAELVNTILVEERKVEGLAGIKIPIYGVFADLIDQRVSSYYYLSLAAMGSYSFWHNATQYAQVLTSSDSLRFPNKTDTTQRWNAPLANFNQTRINVDVALGWGLSGEVALGSVDVGLAAMMELFCTIPTGTIVSGVEWRQYSVGGRFAIGWHRRLGK
jgi:hypothetical protein